MELAVADRGRLERIVGDRNSPMKHVYRARIVLLRSDGLGSTRIAKAVGKSEPTVRRWLARFAAAGVDGLLRDATRPPGKKPLARSVVERVVHMTLHELPADATPWSARRLAKAVGIGHGAVQKIWSSHGLKPHLVRRFKLSNDPNFAEKLRDVVGLYVNPPEHAIVLSVDEKSQIQALDRTQPGLPMKRGKAGTMTHLCTAPAMPHRLQDRRHVRRPPPERASVLGEGVACRRFPRSSCHATARPPPLVSVSPFAADGCSVRESVLRTVR